MAIRGPAVIPSLSRDLGWDAMDGKPMTRAATVIPSLSRDLGWDPQAGRWDGAEIPRWRDK